MTADEALTAILSGDATPENVECVRFACVLVAEVEAERDRKRHSADYCAREGHIRSAYKWGDIADRMDALLMRARAIVKGESSYGHDR